MSIVAVPKSLEPLVNFLNQADSRVPIEGLQKHLSELNVTLDDLTQYLHFNDCSYSRNLICENTWYELLCICWKNGQESLIHNHAQSTCGLRVIQGVGVETTFEEIGDNKVKPIESCELKTGEVCCTKDADIHQISNVQPDGSDLVTLHIYSPPLRTMQVWDMEM